MVKDIQIFFVLYDKLKLECWVPGVVGHAIARSIR